MTQGTQSEGERRAGATFETGDRPMTMDTESVVARRLVQLCQHLGLTQVHLAARVTDDWHGLISTQPEMIASLSLVCPTGLEASPLRSLATRLFMLTGD